MNRGLLIFGVLLLLTSLPLPPPAEGAARKKARPVKTAAAPAPAPSPASAPAPAPAPATAPEPAPPVEPVKAPAPAQESYTIEPLGKGIYAALAKVGGKANSNAIFVIGDKYVVAAGAHLTKEAIRDLYAAVAALTAKPVRYIVLSHHHSGYTHIDFDFPPDQDVITSWQAWQDLTAETRRADFPVIFFNEGMTLKPGGATVILTNLGRGHSSGDVVTYIPEAGVVFASDLFYVNSIGYMGGGYMREWVLALDFLEQLGAQRIIPGTGPVSSVDEVTEFKEFFKDFLTEVLKRVERGESFEQILKDFDMPKYRDTPGYQQLIKVNLKRAYTELQEEFGR